MSQEHIQIIEINGVKLEVDLRTAKRIDTLRVGSRVKVLVKQYSDTFQTHPGVVVGFDAFVNRPSITVAYLENDYSKASLKFIAINKDSSENIEIIADVNEKALDVNRDEILSKMEKEIAGLHRQIEEIEDKKQFFLKHFGSWLGSFD